MRLDQFASHRQQAAVALEDDTKTRLHPAFLCATGTQAGCVFIQIIEVARQLTLKKLAGIHAANGENALMG
ncbi:hypothetical protein KUIN1_39380 [Pseudomonas sp. KUIN-1]|nr:hypothetical protein KUIN1_39380 [Pseudomonas sp. KUIN-1]